MEKGFDQTEHIVIPSDVYTRKPDVQDEVDTDFNRNEYFPIENPYVVKENNLIRRTNEYTSSAGKCSGKTGIRKGVLLFVFSSLVSCITGSLNMSMVRDVAVIDKPFELVCFIPRTLKCQQMSWIAGTKDNNQFSMLIGRGINSHNPNFSFYLVEEDNLLKYFLKIHKFESVILNNWFRCECDSIRVAKNFTDIEEKFIVSPSEWSLKFENECGLVSLLNTYPVPAICNIVIQKENRRKTFKCRKKICNTSDTGISNVVFECPLHLSDDQCDAVVDVECVTKYGLVLLKNNSITYDCQKTGNSRNSYSQLMIGLAISVSIILVIVGSLVILLIKRKRNASRNSSQTSSDQGWDEVQQLKT